ncbi:O-antigen ligase family protein [Paenochrobactrum glaciei]|uniref:O-antigen ligase-related domain-containing protein n=1 Tax=Paenochrobactrum glaciei TaxID=486407 RepID=A0ABN1FJF4_9HYPH
MTFLYKSFLKRRKIDPWVLAVGGAAMPVRIGLGPLAVFLFSCIGIYLTAFRHKSTKPFVGLFMLFLVLYCLWTLGLMVWRDQLAINNRHIGYTLLLLLYSFVGAGMVLVRDPLRFYVLGSRVGIFLSGIFALFMSLYSGARVGVGGNEAVFSFVAAVGAVSATLPIQNAPRFLRNGPQWLALGLLAVIVSETRAILVVLPLILLVEIIAYVRKLSWQKQGGVYAVLAAFIAAMLVVGPIGKVIETRFAAMLNYYETGDATVWSDKVSADIRIAMWRGAIETIKENPLTGVGSIHKVEIVQSHLGDERELLDGFIHVHNVVFDELLNGGLIGFLLLTAAFMSVFVQLWKTAPDCGTKRVLSYFAIVTIAYGMLHAPLVHETTIAVIMLFLGVLNAARVKRVIYKPHLNAA